MLDRGVYPPPSQFEAWFVSLAHDEEAIDRTLEAAAESLDEALPMRAWRLLRLYGDSCADEDTPIPPTPASSQRSCARSRVSPIVAAAGLPARPAPGEYALVIEAVREGYLLHYGEPRLLAGHDADLALLAGDYLYALGIERLAALGDTEAVARPGRPDQRLRPAPHRRPRGRGPRAVLARVASKAQ